MMKPLLTTMVMHTPEYHRIKIHYGNSTAERSGIPLINHIDEGLLILDQIGASVRAGRAYCLHPIFQADEDLEANIWAASTFDSDVMTLVMEYRNIANAYLSRRSIDEIEDIRISPLIEVNQMLIADKVQNRKDFEKFHLETHPRAKELDEYFRNWLNRLGITEQRYQNLIAVID